MSDHPRNEMFAASQDGAGATKPRPTAHKHIQLLAWLDTVKMTKQKSSAARVMPRTSFHVASARLMPVVLQRNEIFLQPPRLSANAVAVDVKTNETKGLASACPPTRNTSIHLTRSGASTGVQLESHQGSPRSFHLRMCAKARVTRIAPHQSRTTTCDVGTRHGGAASQRSRRMNT